MKIEPTPRPHDCTIGPLRIGRATSTRMTARALVTFSA
jgi:hypothetical protein